MSTLDKSKVDAAMKRAKQDEDDAGKRKYNSLAEVDVTEEDMEAYRLRKVQKSDPMAKIGSDELLEYK